MRRAFSKEVRDWSGDDVLAVAFALVDRHRWVAYELVYHHPDAPLLLNREAVEQLGSGLDSWRAAHRAPPAGRTAGALDVGASAVAASPAMPGTAPFRLQVPEADLDDLRQRLGRTRWPDAKTVDDWAQSVPLRSLQRLFRYSADGYDWRATEARLNAWPQLIMEVDGLCIHRCAARQPVACWRQRSVN